MFREKKILISIAFIMLISATSCKFSNQQNKMLDALEESGVEMPENIQEPKETNYLDITLVLTRFILNLLYRLLLISMDQKKKDQFGFVMSDITEKFEEIKKSEHHEKMNEEQKKELDDIMKLINK